MALRYREIQLTNYLFNDFQLRARALHLAAVQPAAARRYRIFRDKSSFSGLADDENSVLLIETTQLLLGSVDTVAVYSPTAEFETVSAAAASWMQGAGWSKLQGTQLWVVRTYLDVILIHEYADRDYLRY